MKNILLPTDFSKNSINAIGYALEFLKDQKCQFYILNVQKASSFITDDMMVVNSSTTIYKTLINSKKIGDKVYIVTASADFYCKFIAKLFKAKLIFAYDLIFE